MSSPMEPVAKEGDLLLDGRVRIDRVYKPDNLSCHAYVLSFPELRGSTRTPSPEIQIGFQQSAEKRKWDLLQQAKRHLAQAEKQSKHR